MTFTVDRQDERTVIHIAGPLDAASAAEARQTFESVIDTASGSVDLDLSQTDFIDSSGVGAIVFIYKRLVLQGRAMTLQGVCGQPRDLIGMLRLDRTIPTVELVA